MGKDDRSFVKELNVRLRALNELAHESRDLPPLSVDMVRDATELHSGNFKRVLASLAGRFGKSDPHLRKIGDDSHITGQTIKLDRPNRWGVTKNWIDDPEHVARIRYNKPITRPGRPINAHGSSSIHFDFEAIDKAQLELGLPNANGHRVSPGDHVEYIDRVEADAELVQAIRKLAPAPIAVYTEYQERPDAISTIEHSSGDAAIFTNIPGDKADRIELFTKLADIERVDRLPSLELRLDHKSDMMRKIRREMVDDGKLKDWAWARQNASLTVTGAKACELAARLGRLGWQDKREKHDRQNRKFDSAGICFDPGKSGTCQIRLVGELPHDVPHESRVRILRGLCEEFEKRGLPYIAVIHAPGPTNDDRNWHFHLVYSDRPVALFDGTAATHVQITDANGKIPQSKISAKRKALADPAVIAQVGKWDFEVVSVRTKKNRERVKSYPLRQRKDRDVTRDSFVPGLRAKLCDLTNAELERHGVDRRVDPLSHVRAGRKQTPGKKLHATLHAQEMAGIPTQTGTSNEFKQWFAREDELLEQDQLVFERTYVSADERSTIRARFPNPQERGSFIETLGSLRREIAELRQTGAKAREVLGRLQSRPNLMLAHYQNLMLGELAKKTPNKARLETFSRQVDHAAEHMKAMRLLGGDLFQIGRDADLAIDALERQVRAMEIEAGLRVEPVFDFDIVEPKVSQIEQPTAKASEVERTASFEADQRTQGSPAMAVASTARGQGAIKTPASSKIESLTETRAEITSPLTKSSSTDVPKAASVTAVPVTPDASRPVHDEPVVTPIAPRISTQPRLHKPGSTPNDHARRRRVAKEISALARSRVAFSLTEETVGGVQVKVARIDAPIAKLHGLPERIEAWTRHEQSRLEGIAARRQAAVLISRFPKDYPEPVEHNNPTNLRRNESPKEERALASGTSADRVRSGSAPASDSSGAAAPIRRETEIAENADRQKTDDEVQIVSAASHEAPVQRPEPIGSAAQRRAETSAKDGSGLQQTSQAPQGEKEAPPILGSRADNAHTKPFAETAPQAARPDHAVPAAARNGTSVRSTGDTASTATPTVSPAAPVSDPGKLSNSGVAASSASDPSEGDTRPPIEHEPVQQQKDSREETIAEARASGQPPSLTINERKREGGAAASSNTQLRRSSQAPATEQPSGNPAAAPRSETIKRSSARAPETVSSDVQPSKPVESTTSRPTALPPSVSRHAEDQFRQVREDVKARRLLLRRTKRGAVRIFYDDREVLPEFAQLIRKPEVQAFFAPLYDEQRQDFEKIGLALASNRIQLEHAGRVEVVGGDFVSGQLLERWLHNGAVQNSLRFFMSLPDRQPDGRTFEVAEAISGMLGGSSKSRDRLEALFPPLKSNEIQISKQGADLPADSGDTKAVALKSPSNAPEQKRVLGSQAHSRRSQSRVGQSGRHLAPFER